MSWRKGLATHSKFKNVFGETDKKDRCYENVKVSKNAWDGAYCAANPKFLAVVLDTSGGGGAFLVIPLEKVGRQKTDAPRVVGHQREVLDLQWNPFNDHIIASASEDTTVKIWRVPPGGLTEDLLEPLVDLRGHQRKVGLIRWHPTANGIIASAAFDFKVIVWNALKAKVICTVDGHRDTIYDLAFNYDGSMMASTSKDKKIRLMNARTGKVQQILPGHSSPKPSHIAFSDKTGERLVSTGFSSSGERTIALWDLNNPSPLMKSATIDNSSGVLMLYYDVDVSVAYVAGKGDGMICYYEVMKEEPYLFRLSEYRHSTPQKSLGKLSKRGLDTSRCEIFRFYKLHPNNWIEPIHMICPRRSDEFQEDLYPPTPSMQPALTAEEWVSGVDKDPNLMSLKDGGSHVPSAGTASTTSSADKLNSNFNKPAKFERMLSKDVMLSNDVNHSAGVQSPIARTVQHEVHAAAAAGVVDDQELQKAQQLLREQSKQIEALNLAVATKDRRITELEHALVAKERVIAETRDQFSVRIARLTEENEQLTAKAARSAVDGRPPPRSEERVTVTKATTEARLRRGEPMASARGAKRPVDEAITSSQKARSPLDDIDFQQAFDEPAVRTEYARAERTPAAYQDPAGKSAGVESPTEDYLIEDIEAELESLREDLARTREVRHTGEGPGRGGGEPEVASSSRQASSHGYGGRTFVSTSPPKHGGPPRFPPKSGHHGDNGVAAASDDKRMVITTASYARVPSVERQSTSAKDKKSYL